jgi:hypothetical protein
VFLVLFLDVQVMPYFCLRHPVVFCLLQNNCQLSLIPVYYVIEMYDKHNCISLGMDFIDRTPSVASCMYEKCRKYFVPLKIYIGMHFVAQKIAISV